MFLSTEDFSPGEIGEKNGAVKEQLCKYSVLSEISACGASNEIDVLMEAGMNLPGHGHRYQLF